MTEAAQAEAERNSAEAEMKRVPAPPKEMGPVRWWLDYKKAGQSYAQTRVVCGSPECLAAPDIYTGLQQHAIRLGSVASWIGWSVFLDQDSTAHSTRQTSVGHRPKRILVASGKGGSGKTTTVRNLAVAAVHAGVSVTTVDLDESPTLTTWWKRRPDLLPAIEHMAAPIDQIEGDLRMEIEAIQDCNLVIVDTPPSLTAYPQHARGLIRVADLVLVPCQQYDEDLDAVIAWIALARDLGANNLVVLNRTQRRESSFEAAKRRLVKVGRLCPIDIPHFADVPKTFGKGLGVAEVRGAKGGADYEAVLDHIRNEIGF